ncbi:sigma-54 dependent transcriptional regulator [Fulvivirgaceae bacterium BMA10]|uniref:Sigma-54 dependent transcriptional regulator n=1 Tax=Splendidivirga corallicola TaxID=3051826 RepID=A0ABT8KJY3_9BACT|nr:sigma-54 dependent transcriptional regulator [Fulvivirgaceae bacterium BMA10]
MEKMVKVFIVDDDEMLRDLIKMNLEELNDVDISLFEDSKDLLDEIHLNPDVVVVDYHLPSMNGIEVLKEINRQNNDIATIILSGQKDVEVVVDAYKNGAKNYIIKNENTFVELKNSIQNLMKNIQLHRELESLRDQVIENNRYEQIIGESAGMRRVFNLMKKVENTKLVTLVTGESGTGKELVASALHYSSTRQRKPFIPVNVAAIPEDLIESELFGHEKGAFTGASGRRIGKFEAAQKGTIFLDEIGEMDFNLQKKLLRVLQESKVCRLGSNKEIDLDVRVIAATNKNLGTLVKEGKFREDLYYRLQGFLIPLPPLRDRENDVILIAKYFMNECCEKNKLGAKSFDMEVMKEFLEYHWPGNVRELRSVVERACLLNDGDKIGVEDLIFSEAVA